MQSGTRLIGATVVGITVLTLSAEAAIIYVDVGSPVDGNGSSWQSPLVLLQDALAIAQSGDEIRVAGGVYKPDQDSSGLHFGDREATFQIGEAITVNGGYAGSALRLAPNTRNIKTYATTLREHADGPDS